jgi:hypothetical protein
MNFQFYLEKLNASQQFKEFMKENPDAFLCSGFFSIDKQNADGGNSQQHLDYYVPSLKKMFSFKLEDECKMIPLEGPSESVEKVSENADFNFEEVEKLIVESMKENNVDNKLQKIFLSLQAKDKKNFLICTVFVSSLALVRVDIDPEKMEVISFDKKSFFDMIKIKKKGRD